MQCNPHLPSTFVESRSSCMREAWELEICAAVTSFHWSFAEILSQKIQAILPKNSQTIGEGGGG